MITPHPPGCVCADTACKREREQSVADDQHDIALDPTLPNTSEAVTMTSSPTTPPKSKIHPIDVQWDDDDNSVEIPDFHFDWGLKRSQEKGKPFESFATPPVHGRITSLQHSANTSLNSSVGSSEAAFRSEISARSATTSLPTPPDEQRSALGRRSADDEEEERSAGSRSQGARIVSEPLLSRSVSGTSVRYEIDRTSCRG